ncbi:MAG TPA: hypothetical protein VFU82_07000 [Gammaproteobacteria bacterium]|jgi:multisubunit Na+/H+ antiporter MnhB subunit|nr:hypothetical protein [Gammaproteobacteria bacterium]
MSLHTLWAKIPDAVGLAGVACLLIAYYLLNAGRISEKSFSYQWLNFFGGGFLLFSLFFHWNIASVVIQVAWMAISMMGMASIYQARKKLDKKASTLDEVTSSAA